MVLRIINIQLISLYEQHMKCNQTIDIQYTIIMFLYLFIVTVYNFNMFCFEYHY